MSWRIAKPRGLRKAAGFARFAAETAVVAASGEPIRVDRQTYRQRIAACGSCCHNIDNECQLCGCLMPRKARYTTATCPDSPSRWTT